MDKAIFYDRDGTLNDELNGYVHKVEDFKLLLGVVKGLKCLSKEFIFFIITNQSGIGRGMYKEEDMDKFNKKLVNELKKENIEIKKIYHCPHLPNEKCDCRKPSTKYIKQAAKEFNIDIKQSWVVGDHPHDVEMGIRSGCKSIYLTTGHGKKHLDELKNSNIKPNFIAKNFVEAAEFIMADKMTKKTINANELKNIVESLKKQSKKIVTTNGVFDILHIGHIRYLKEAKKFGDILVVAINSDSSVKKIKGPKRPLNNENDRAEALAALECVNYVVIFNEKSPIKILEIIKPNIHVKGGDYKIEQIIEKDVVEKNHGKIILIPEVKGYSTTDFIKRIAGVYKNN